MVRVALEPGVDHTPHGRMLLERARQGERALADAVDTENERLHAARDQPRVKRGHLTAGIDRQMADRCDPLRAAGNNTAGHVAVAAQILGRGVTHEIRTVLQRTYHHRRRER